MKPYSHAQLNKQLTPGHVYRRESLLPFSGAVDRDLRILVHKGMLKKLSPGVYYKPAQSEFGLLPPNDEDLVACFLKDKKFLLYSMSQYNALGVGLTQAYNRVIVLNTKRHGVFKLGNREFDFRLSNKGFPRQLTPEFLLVDLVNNLSELAEDTSLVKANILKNIEHFQLKKLKNYVSIYGKIATKKFFKEFLN